jgi:L-iditol 2-dehydrogenase/threonine 3-dehydrogenase
MRQAVMTSPGQIEFRDVPDPQPGPGQVLLRVRRIGICGSDVHVWHGRHPFTKYPVVQGHEFSATVEAVGEGVAGIGEALEGLEPGVRATARPQVVCGECRACRSGRYNICYDLKVEGFQAPGCAQELFVTDADRLVVLPDEFTFEQGAMVEPASVAVHATVRPGEVVGRNAVVLGVGTIGNLVAQMARCRGADVLATDVSDFRLDVARRCGIEATSNAGSEPLAEAVGRVFGEEGFDLAFDCAGAEAAVNAAIESISKGGTIVVVAVYGERPRVNLACVGEWELRMIGSLMYRHEDYEEAVRRIAAGEVVTEPLDSKHFPFEDYGAAYEFIEAEGPQAMKVFIEL